VARRRRTRQLPVIYGAVVAMQAVRNDRTIMLILPPLAVLAALAIEPVMTWAHRQRTAGLAATGVAVAVLVVGAVARFPHLGPSTWNAAQRWLVRAHWPVGSLGEYTYSPQGRLGREGYPMTESTAVGVDPSNVEQLGAWDGDVGAYWAAHADRFDEGVAGYHGQLLAAAAIDATATVLDIGCGSGQTTRDAARCATAGSALGVDLSSRMIELACQLAAREHVANVTFRQADAQVYPFPDQCFDIAMSRTGAMFFGNTLAAFTNIARALRPGGRLVLLAWQPLQQNEWFSAFFAALAAGRELSPPQPGTPGPFSLSDPDRVRRLLTSAGFVDVRLQGLSEPMYFGPDPDDACQFISGLFAWMVRDLDADTRGHALDSLRASVTDHQTDRGVLYDSAAWLIEARRS
jgi:SAM-dependent methyltransferase